MYISYLAKTEFNKWKSKRNACSMNVYLSVAVKTQPFLYKVPTSDNPTKNPICIL